MGSVSEKFIALKEHLLNIHEDGIVSISTIDFLDLLEVTSNCYFINTLVARGFMTKIANTFRIPETKKWSPAKYKINEIELENHKEKIGKSVKAVEAVEATAETVEEEETTEVVETLEIAETPIGTVAEIIETLTAETKVITEDYCGISIRLFNKNGKLLISLNDVADGIGLDRLQAKHIIEQHYDVFESVIECDVITTDPRAIENVALSKEGIVGLLVRASIANFPAEKKERVLNFQKWAIDKLGEIISEGNIQFTEQEHAKIQADFKDVTEMSDVEVDIILNGIKDMVDLKLLQVQTIIKDKNDEIKALKAQRDVSINRENQLKRQIPELIEQRINLFFK